MAHKKIRDTEFLGWIYYFTSESGFWIYYSADNSKAAMVDPKTEEVLFVIDRRDGEKLYQHPEVKKFMKRAVTRPLDAQFNPRIL